MYFVPANQNYTIALSISVVVMGEAQELQLHIIVQEGNEANSLEDATVNHQSPLPRLRDYKWWLRITIYTLFVLSGQSTGTLLGRLYYDKGGNSKWMATLVVIAGFPILLPLSLFLSPPTNPATNHNLTYANPSSAFTLAFLYVFLGLLLAGVNMMYTYGLLYLPVSTYSLICATQLAFTALFSFFLNSQKFTPFIINSVVIVTISATLLIFQPNSADTMGTSNEKYAVGFLCTVGASAGYSLLLSLTQLSFQKILKRETFIVVLEMIIYQSLVATCVSVLGLFASGEWKSLTEEMEKFGLGKLSYVMTLVWTAVAWQVFSIGSVGLIFEVSSLFSNVISTVALPVIPILAVIFFHDTMDGMKVVAMLLAIWGFVSYIYQHYLDDSKSKAAKANVDEILDTSTKNRPQLMDI
ncbi:hypothetical protein HHK36_001594 [Tetracentron sinense]|uniref:Probable purine permease n=1 Tax=Tetracentron sinense TaxID=13715 RepID=A0A835A3Y5_TETSI|nr:hypothetical protein HHK36_001594 [Tetracentron sinense]